MLAIWETGKMSVIGSVIGPLVSVTTEFEKKLNNSSSSRALVLTLSHCYAKFN